MTDRGGAPAFGDVTGEYLALRNATAYVTGWHDVVWVRGPDAVSFLEGLLSQAIEPLAADETARSLLLAPQGKLRAPHFLLRGENEIGLVADSGMGERVAGDLARFKVRVDATIEEEARPVVDLWGPGSGAALESAGLPVPQGWTRSGDAVIARLPFVHVGLDRLVVVGVDPAVLQAAGVHRAGRLAADAVRIEAGEPIMNVDIDERTIPQEAGLVDGAVDFTKGCYLGQELVARIDSRGHVNRQLRGFVLGANVLPPIGAEIVHEGKPIGALTSVAESLELRAPIGLGLVRREVAPGAAVTLRWTGADTEAQVRELPLDGFDA